jgi:hypothetical protein
LQTIFSITPLNAHCPCNRQLKDRPGIPVAIPTFEEQLPSVVLLHLLAHIEGEQQRRFKAGSNR